MNREPIKILGDIIKEFMVLTDQQIMIYNQNFKLPQTSGLFVILQYNTSKVYSAKNQFIPAPEGDAGGQESITTLTQEGYTINIISRDDEARQRKEEVILSLNTNFAQDQQELYQFKIAQISNSFRNVSELEGAAMINRFAIDISLLARYEIIRDVEYYDSFTNTITTD